jgi:urea transport system permease protein
VIDLDTLVQQLFNGISLASIYIIVALGLQVLFGLMGIINLAHGEFILIGAYVTFLLQTAGIPFLVSLVVSVIAALVIGFILEKSVIRFLYDYPLDTLLVTWGLSIVMREISKLIFGAAPKPLATPISGGFEAGDLVFPYWRIIVILTCVLVVWFIYHMLNRSNVGMKIRATLENKDLALSMGVNVKQMYQVTFLMGAVLAAISGAIVIPLSSVSPDIGLSYLLPSFLVVIIGGIGSFKGVVYGGLFIGGLSSLLTIFMSAVTAEIVVFFIVVILLRFRPDGVFIKNPA